MSSTKWSISKKEEFYLQVYSVVKLANDMSRFSILDPFGVLFELPKTIWWFLTKVCIYDISGIAVILAQYCILLTVKKSTLIK